MSTEEYLARRIPTLLRQEIGRPVSDNREPLSWAIEGLGSVYVVWPDKLLIERRGERGKTTSFSFDPSDDYSLGLAVSDCAKTLES